MSNILTIDNDLRKITIPDTIKNLGVESDDDVLRLHFSMPRMYGTVDLAEFDIRINYQNAGNEGDVYVVADKYAEPDTITFSWLVDRTATAYKGNVKFIVCLKLLSEDGIVVKEFNTTVASLPVLEGLETAEKVVQENPDVLEQILRRLDNLEQNGTGGGSGGGSDSSQNGEDGFSPIATVEQTDAGAVITVTDKDGTTTATITNGKSGADGAKGDKGDKGDPGEKGETGAQGIQGEKGDKGDTGAKGDKGDTGATGKAGADGYTPVRGTDYWTESDKAEIVATVIESLGGNPVFGYVDENNNIIVSGNLPDGSYTVKYEMEDGSTVEIGDLVLDSNVYYSVTNNLTNCANSNSATQAVQGGSYSAIISAKSGYELSSVKVTMGGTDISDTAVSVGTITIANVTGNIVITAVATEIVETVVNVLDTAYDTDLKTVYGGVGYVENKRISISAGGATNSTGNILTGLIPLGNDGDVFHIRGITDFAWVSGKYIGQYSCWGATGNLLSTEMKAYSADLIGTDENGDKTLTMTHSKFTLPSGTAYIRFQFGMPTGDVIITRNQLIPV